MRRAAKGETDAYTALATDYFDLICEYLYLCNLTRDEASRETETLLRAGWKRLPCLKRLSDWERFLARALMEVRPGIAPAGDVRSQALVDLDRESKFALIAFDLENWDYRWLSLALRVPASRLQRMLFETRCRLLELNLSRAGRGLRRQLALISADLDGQLRPGQQREAIRRLSVCEETKAFKSGWLAYRCHLIETRQQIRLPESERDSLLGNLSRRLSREEMVRPSLFRRFRNLVSFEDPAPPGMMPAGQDFRFGDS